MTTQSPGAKSFAYEAQTSLGHIFKGTLQAASPDEVQSRLSELQLKVIDVSPSDQPAPRRRAMGADEFVLFNQQLAHLTQAGLPVERGLRLIAIDLQSGRLAQAAQDVAAELERGLPLQDAFSRHASRFPPLYGKLVEAGLTAGNLPAMLFNLGKHLELIGRLRRSLIRTLAYPAVVIAAISLVLLFISHYVLPQFEDIYTGFRMTLPGLTRIMISVGHVYPFIFAVFWSVVAMIVLTDVLLRASGGRGIPWFNVLAWIPFLGKILKANVLARWMDSLRVGIEAGLDLPHAIAISADAINEPALTRDAAALSNIVSRGLPLSGYRGSTIPPTIAAAIDLAGQAGDLPAALHSLSRMYEQQAEHRLRALPSILTPLLLMLIGGGVSITIAAMFFPFIRLIQSFSSGD